MRLLPATLALPLLLALAAPAAPQDHHHPAAAGASAPAPGQRWKTDPPLREGMGRVHAAVAALEHDEHGHLGPRQVTQLASNVQRDIGFIVANCKLEPRADAALHPILGVLAEGAQALKATPADPTPIASMRRALQDYARRFDDPGFAPGPPADASR